MIDFPKAKLNLGLRVLDKREDGYHNIESLLITVGLCDVLEVVRTDSSADRLIVTGRDVECDCRDNLCIKALELLRKEHNIPPVSVYLQKNIPVGAGLGGGSSDAASMLKLLNREFLLNIPLSRLIEYSLFLGSDCPFFLYEKPMLVRGKGDVLTPFTPDLNGIFVVVVKPSDSVNTSQAYANIGKMSFTTSFEEILRDRNCWVESLSNSFESYVFGLYPEVGLIKESLYNQGAFYASMSGSGSAVYGFFNREIDVNEFFPSCFVFQGWLK